MNSITQFVAALLVLALFGLVGWFFFLRPRTDTTSPPSQPLKGIGGWLIVVAIGQAATPLALILRYALDFREYWSLWKTQLLPIAGEAILNLGIILFVIWCSISFFGTRKSFPRLFIWELWLLVFLRFVDDLWVSLTTGASLNNLVSEADTKGNVRALVIAIVWTAYTLKSVRVKNTFVN
jgi:hypothetical protein